MKSKKPASLIITIAIMIIAIAGFSAFAARSALKDLFSPPTTTESSQSERDPDDPESIETSQIESQTTDAVSSATAEPSAQPGTTDATSSATPRQTVTNGSVDTVSSATARPDDDDDEDDDEDDENDDDRDSDDDRHLISADQAKAIALAYAGSQAAILEIELEDDYPPAYSIDLVVDRQKIELKIHAITGAILDYHRENEDDGADQD